MSERPHALVTGASSGIGAVYARRLAAAGYDLTLVARRQEKLDALADALRDDGGGTVLVRAVDLADDAALATLVAAVAAGPRLDLLVNNAGFGTSALFAASEIERQLEMLTVHCAATMRLCHAALPAMIAAGQGSIVNVASISAYLPNPGTTTYSATKSFLVVLSEGLAREVGPLGVRIQALCPGFTTSEFHDTAEFERFQRSQIPSLMWQSAEAVVDHSLRALRGNSVVVVPGWPNRLLVGASRLGLASLIMRGYGRLKRR